MFNQAKPISPYQHAADSAAVQGLLEQNATQHLSALACLVFEAAQRDLRLAKSHSSDCMQIRPW